MTDINKDIQSLALQQLKTLYLYYRNAYGYQTWPPNLIKSRDPVITWSGEITLQLKPLYLYQNSAYSHQTWYSGGNLPRGDPNLTQR